MSVPKVVLSTSLPESNAMSNMIEGCSLYSSSQSGCRSPPPGLGQRGRYSQYRDRSTSPSMDSNSAGENYVLSLESPQPRARKEFSEASIALAKTRSRNAQKINDSMVYLNGPEVYTCNQCRTHLTSHDDIISKSFHGRHGRAYLFEHCVNIVIGPAEDRMLITGLHSVCDTFCKRCKGMVGWTYAKAYEPSQKYKEGKFIIEKINLHMEENSYYDIRHPVGERVDRWRRRSMKWGVESGSQSSSSEVVHEYYPSDSSHGSLDLPPSPYSEKSLSGVPTKTQFAARQRLRSMGASGREVPPAPSF
mmetsp:Transcript_4497/g.7791  ORF Transcript_4497/g.7791 Transcript_4497/m.7791 type:complete len:305 (-) Transcript_4497:208-1122(-)